ncbi:MAG: XisI protein [Cyanobacteria bacterium P01_A01_bin.114]
MDQLERFRQVILSTLTEHAAIPYAFGDIQSQVIVSQDGNSYLLMTSGWEDGVRVHACMVHIDIIDQKIWIQRDGTEDGIANDLVAQGIAKDQIVLGFHPIEIRQHTEYAFA